MIRYRNIYIILVLLLVMLGCAKQISKEEACNIAIEFYDLKEGADYVECSVFEGKESLLVSLTILEGFPFSDEFMFSKGYVKNIDYNNSKNLDNLCQDIIENDNKIQYSKFINCTTKKYGGKVWLYLSLLPGHPKFNNFETLEQFFDEHQNEPVMLIEKKTGIFRISSWGNNQYKKTADGFLAMTD